MGYVYVYTVLLQKELMMMQNFSSPVIVSCINFSEISKIPTANYPVFLLIGNI